MPWAPSIEVSSSSGLATAFCAASRARFSPFPVPVPIIASPMPDMIVRTSAKSRLTSPGTRIKSEIPCTACCRTESATRNAAISGVPRSTTDSSRWLGIVMSVSTTARNASSPASAWTMRFRPSKTKGLVTTATVRMPRSFASDATTGAAPVPVPPPSPAVMNTMSAPLRSRVIWSGSSCAALRPTSGFEPAPSPPVSLVPSWSLIGAGEAWRAWRSVLATMNSTPVNCAAIIRLTALPPPPPRPITLIFAACTCCSSSKSGRRVRSFSIEVSSEGSSEVRLRPRERITSDGNKGGCRPSRPDLEDVTQKSCREPHQTAHRGGACRAPRLARGPRVPAVERQADGGRVDRALDRVRQPTDADGHAPAHGLIEDALGELGDALHDRGAAGDDDAGRRRVLKARPGQLARHQREDLLHARLDDLREELSRELPRLPSAHRRHVDRLLGRDQLRQCASVALLDVLGVRGRRAQPDRDVVGDVVAAERQDRRVPDGAVAQEGDVGRAAADVDHHDAELFLVVVEHRLGGGEGLEHDVLDGEARAIHRADDVLHRGDGAGHDVHLDLEAHARHADGLEDPVSVVDDEALRQDMDDLAVLGQIDRARRLDDALHVGLAHLVVLAGDRDGAAAVDAADVAARHPGVHARDLDARHLLGLGDGGLDRLDRRVDVDDDPPSEPAGGCGPDPDDVQDAPGRGLGDDRADLRGADVP